MARKTQRDTLVIVSLVLLGIFIISQGGLNFLSTGSNTLAIGQVDLQSNNQYLNEKAWYITFSGGGAGQSFYGNFDSSQIADGQQTAEKDFSINVDYSPTTCNYDIISTSSNIPIVVPIKKEWGYIPFVNPCDSEEAHSRGISQVQWYGQVGGTLTCFAIGFNEQYPVGNIDNPDKESEFTIDIDVQGGPSASKTFNTLTGSHQGEIGNFAYGIYAGNLDSGISCPAQDDYKTAFVNSNWRVIDESIYLDYRRLLTTDDLIDRCGSGTFFTRSCIDNWYGDYSTLSNSADNSKSFGSIINSNSLSNGKINIVTNTPIQFPVNTLYIKASTIGVFTPVPDIRINSVSSDCFANGDTGVVTAEIQNTGQQGGTYNAFLECESPFSPTTSKTGSISAGETITINIPVTGSADSKTTGQLCTLHVESTGTEKIKPVNMCIDPQISCLTPFPDKFCGFTQGNQAGVFQCTEDGGSKNLLETCTTGNVCYNGECVDESVVQKGNGWFNDIINSFKKFFSDPFGVISSFVSDVLFTLKGVVVVVGSVVSGFFINDLLNKIKSTKNRKGLKIVLSLFSALSVGIFLNGFIGSASFYIIAIGVVLGMFLLTKIGISPKKILGK